MWAGPFSRIVPLSAGAASTTGATRVANLRQWKLLSYISGTAVTWPAAASAGTSSLPIFLAAAGFLPADKMRLRREPAKSSRLFQPRRWKELLHALRSIHKTFCCPLRSIQPWMVATFFVCTTSTIPSLVFKTSDYLKSEYRASVLSADHPGQTAGFYQLGPCLKTAHHGPSEQVAE